MRLADRLRSWMHGLRRHGQRHLRTLALLAAVWLAVQAWQTRGVAGGPLPDAALDAPLPVLVDGALRQSSLRAELAALHASHPGRNIGLYVWATWCPICSMIEGTVNGLTPEHPVLTIAMQSGPPETVARHLTGRDLAWLTVVDPHSAIPAALGLGAVPAFAVITPQGELRWPTVGLSSGWGLRLRLWLGR
ncbi:MAG: protein disulfide oxidoreductase [Betaproteobacteria bacterium]|nr:protein disulfide oxidoreductase [Betaproteobacteria bacterium]